MVDQNQFQDPQTQGAQKDDQDTGVFGGGDDVFDNLEVLEPIDETGDSEKKETEVEKDEKIEDSNEPSESEKVEEVVEKVEEKKPQEVNPIYNNPSVDNDDDFFDPFNDDEDVEVEEKKPEAKTDPIIKPEPVEEIKKEEKVETKEKEDDFMPNFGEDESIDALDEIPEIKEIKEPKDAGETGEKEKVEEVVEKIETTPIVEEEPKEKQSVGYTSPNMSDIANKIEDKDIPQKKEEIEPVVEEKEEEEIVIPEKKEVNPMKTDLQNKFDELINKTKAICELVDKKADEGFDLLGGNDDRQKTTYKIFVVDNIVKIEKLELNKAQETEESNTLEFGLNGESLGVYVDEELLYDEVKDLQENPNKKMQVMEKINKFIFLVSEEYKKVEKEKNAKEKRNKMKGVFRNFVL